MPDHLHFIVWLEDGKLTDFLAQYKPAVTTGIAELAAREGNSRVLSWLEMNGHRELWQDGKHAVALWSGKFIRQKINYIHDNPVRLGLVEAAQDYLWSSYGAYLPDLGIEPPIPVSLDWK